MNKIPTLFLRNPEDMKLVTQEVNSEAAWVLQGYGTPTMKKDGTNIRITVKDGECIHVEKRRNPTREEKAAGAEPGYIDASRDNPADKHIFAAADNTRYTTWPNGQWPCEALGPKIQGGIESSSPAIYPFSFDPFVISEPIMPTYDGIRDFLVKHVIEGIVWHDKEYERYAKIKRRDFGLPWPAKS